MYALAKPNCNEKDLNNCATALVQHNGLPECISPHHSAVLAPAEECTAVYHPIR